MTGLRTILRPLVAVCTALALLSAAATASATVYTVTSSADSVAGSLRAVLASATSGSDTVVIAPGVNPVLTHGPIVLGADVTITGQSARLTTISTSPASTVFALTTSGFPTVNLAQLTITHAASALDVSSGNVVLNNVAITASSATAGGAIVAGCNGWVSATGVTLAGNATTGGIGAAFYDGCSGGDQSSFTNATITANTGGPAVYTAANVNLIHVTVAGNPNGNVTTTGGTVGLFSSILARGGPGANGNCSGTAWFDGGGNVEDTSPTECGLDASHSLIGVNPLLGALANNGGQTDTMLPGAGSPAIDYFFAGCSGTDQRGDPRPDNSEPNCDAGAIEVQDPAPVAGVACTPGSIAVGAAATCTATMTGPAGAPAPSGTIDFSDRTNATLGNGGHCALSAVGPSTSRCAISVTPTATGSDTLTAAYPGDSFYTSTTASTAETGVARATALTVSCSPATQAAGQATDCAVSVTDVAAGAPGTPSGLVTFSAAQGSFDTTTCGLIGTGATALCDVNFTANRTGPVTISASYAPDDSIHAPASGSTTVTVVPATATLAASCSPGVVAGGQSTTCTAVVSAPTTPSGSVTFSSTQGAFPDGATCQLHLAAAGESCAVTFTPHATAGPTTYDVDARYSGDATYPSQSTSTSVASPPVPGVSADTQAISGVVYVIVIQLGKPVSVALKGRTVAVPVGSTVDARKGVVRVKTSADYAHTTSTQTGDFGAALFKIKQLKAKQALKQHHHVTAAFTDVLLLTPKGALARAKCTTHGAPGKGIVRQIHIVAKGRYRTYGAASTTIAAGAANWIVQDRCDGTLTHVLSGHVTVTFGRGHSVAVSAGRTELIKARFLKAKLAAIAGAAVVLLTALRDAPSAA